MKGDATEEENEEERNSENGTIDRLGNVAPTRHGSHEEEEEENELVIVRHRFRERFSMVTSE